MADISDILASVSHPASPPSITDLHALTRAYTAERCAPDLLPYPSALMIRTLSRIRQQISTVEDLSASADSGTKSGFKLIVLQTELERWKWLVRGLLRARIAKIDRYPLHILQNQEADLSGEESEYLRAHQALLERHYGGSFLGAFPAALRRLDDTAGGISMVDGPDTDGAVFVRVLSDVGRVVQQSGDEGMEMKKGDVWLVRWSSVKELVARGDVELV
ncbi:MAG: hypothetical protein Q9157_000384 [Trypethelium eluteriae]